MRSVAADVFLAIAAVLVIISSIGILMMRGAEQKLHYVTPISVLAPFAVGISVLIESGWSSRSAQTWLVVGFMVIAGPYLSHATIRAIRIRTSGDWRLHGHGETGDQE